MKLLPIPKSTLNGRRFYRSESGVFYTFKNDGWGWSVGEVQVDNNHHIKDVKTLGDARTLIASLSRSQ